MLRQIIYSSKASQPLGPTELERILVDARAGNEERGVSGALIYVDGVFVQVLEGERPMVDRLLAGIRGDARHEAMKVFHDVEVSDRAFSNWRMAYLCPDVEDLSRWADLQGTSTIEDLLAHLYRDPQRVPKILISIVKAIADQARRD